MSNIKDVSRYCSYLMISCRPHYLPREFSSVLFVAVYLLPQSEAGTKIVLKQLYKAISKEENAHAEASLWPGTLMQASLNQFYQIFTRMLHHSAHDAHH